MTNAYWIYANISGAAKWHLVYDRRPGMYFVAEDFEEEEYDIEEYRKDFPNNEVVEIPNANEIKNPMGICDEHAKVWGRIDCPLCDALFLYDRLRLAIEVINQAICTLSEMPEISPGVDDLEQDEVNRGKACKLLSQYSDYAKNGMVGETCNCDGIGEARCPKHGWQNMMDAVRQAVTPYNRGSK